MAWDTIADGKVYTWQNHLTSTVLNAGKTPVFWAGFWSGGKEDIDSRQNLKKFIKSVNGFQLADTEWGQAAESEGADNLAACTWDRKEKWWSVASKKLAEGMALRDVQHIIFVLHKNMEKNSRRTFYKSLLYQLELVNIGSEMQKNPTWNPELEVYNIKVPGSGTNTNCATASAMKEYLEDHSGHEEVKVWCRSCSGRSSVKIYEKDTCTKPRPVRRRKIRGKCTGNCVNGEGQKVWPNGDMYEGGWKDGLQFGEGTYTWSGGKMKYHGQYKDGLQDGQGTFTWTNGDQYQGGFKEDEMDGKGTVTLANGEKYEVVYEEGQLKKEYNNIPWR